MKTFLAIDPGPAKSAAAWFRDGAFHSVHMYQSTELAKRIAECCTYIVTEMVQCFGMPVGAEVFETCVWIGRFEQVAYESARVYRKEVKIHLCGSMRAKDANIRQAIIDRYGGKVDAIGTKKNPGPLYGVKGDEWSAIAVGLTYLDTKGKE